MRPRVLFQGSFQSHELRKDTAQQLEVARPVAIALGDVLIRRGLDLVLTGTRSLAEDIGGAATTACESLGISPRERIRTYRLGEARTQPGFGMVLEPADRRWQDIRTFVVQEADALIALLGGKGTSDCIQKAVLARKPVFPIPRAGGAGLAEFERLRSARFTSSERGDLDFLADESLGAEELASEIVDRVVRITAQRSPQLSRRIFIVHGHDAAVKNELARTLEILGFQPVILAERPERGQELLTKLRTELTDVGYAFILLTPDDRGKTWDGSDKGRPRARQNVIFEYGLLLGILGVDRVCAISKGELDLPSDLQGVVIKRLDGGRDVASLALEIARELSAAGYDVDANRLLGSQGI